MPFNVFAYSDNLCETSISGAPPPAMSALIEELQLRIFLPVT